MKSYVVIYRAGNAIQRSLVEKKIKSFSYWARIFSEYWFVKTDYSANQIYEMINPLVGFNGRVVIVAVTRNAGWNYLPQGDFIYKHL